MEKFLTLSLSLIIFLYFYFISIKINSYFKNSRGLIFMILCVFTFSFLFFSIALIFIDVLTTSSDKVFLTFKEEFALNYLCVLEISLLIIIPTIYIYYLYTDTQTQEVDKHKVSGKKKYLYYFFSYLSSLILLNIGYLKMNPYFKSSANNTGFSEKVPEGLALYSKIETDYQKMVYFNFGFLMMVGKFLSFTYLPYGMAKYVHDLIYKPEENTINSIEEKIYENKSEEKTPLLIEQNNTNTQSDHIVIVSEHNDNKSNFFSKSDSNSKSSIDEENKNLENSILFDTMQNNSNNSIITNKSLNNACAIKKTVTVDEYIEKIKEIEYEKQLNLLLKNNNNTVTSHMQFISILNSTFFYFYIITSICIITMILLSKILILYTKLLFNICGVDCGLLAYRFDDLFTLETLTGYLAMLSQNITIKLDFIFFSLILLFRILTVYKAFEIKGISFMWKIFYKIDKNMPTYHIIQIYGTVLFTGIVLLYDFSYLLPDYIRFNGLDAVCDYTLINKSYCGVSFYGLLFIKISMNYHLFMFLDVIASCMFITNGTIWTVRLIVKPLINSVINQLKPDNWKAKNAKLTKI